MDLGEVGEGRFAGASGDTDIGLSVSELSAGASLDTGVDLLVSEVVIGASLDALAEFEVAELAFAAFSHAGVGVLVLEVLVGARGDASTRKEVAEGAGGTSADAHRLVFVDALWADVRREEVFRAGRHTLVCLLVEEQLQGSFAAHHAHEALHVHYPGLRAGRHALADLGMREVASRTEVHAVAVGLALLVQVSEETAQKNF